MCCDPVFFGAVSSIPGGLQPVAWLLLGIIALVKVSVGAQSVLHLLLSTPFYQAVLPPILCWHEQSCVAT